MTEKYSNGYGQALLAHRERQHDAEVDKGDIAGRIVFAGAKNERKVMDLQKALNEDGAKLKLDGDYGAKTDDAYKSAAAKHEVGFRKENKALYDNDRVNYNRLFTNRFDRFLLGETDGVLKKPKEEAKTSEISKEMQDALAKFEAEGVEKGSSGVVENYTSPDVDAGKGLV